MIERIRKIGWLAAEVGLLLIVFSILLNILLGKDGGPFIGSVAENASKFLGGLPPGVTLGIALILLLYWFVKSRLVSARRPTVIAESRKSVLGRRSKARAQSAMIADRRA